jgi:hypothetical protein
MIGSLIILGRGKDSTETSILDELSAKILNVDYNKNNIDWPKGEWGLMTRR